MFKWWPKSEIALGFLIAVPLWIVVLGWQASYSPTDRQKEECYEAAKKTGFKADECKGFWEKATSDPIALFNLILAVSTVGLWLATISLGRSGNRQIRLAREEFTAAHRPRLRVRRIVPNSPFLPNQCVTATIEVANVGETEATVDQMGIDIYRSIFNAAPKAIPTVSIPPGKQANFTVTGSQALTQSDIAAIAANKDWLRLLGIVIYTDGNGTPRTTSFARMYDTQWMRFRALPMNDPEADREFED